MKELLKHDFVDVSYLFDGEGVMVKPTKSDLCTELEKVLRDDDYGSPAAWSKESTAEIVDVMGCVCSMQLTSVKTCNELCNNFMKMIYTLCRSSNRIDFVFDTCIH